MLALLTAFSRRESLKGPSVTWKPSFLGVFICLFSEKVVLTRYAALSLCEMWDCVRIPYVYLRATRVSWRSAINDMKKLHKIFRAVKLPCLAL